MTNAPSNIARTAGRSTTVALMGLAEVVTVSIMGSSDSSKLLAAPRKFTPTRRSPLAEILERTGIAAGQRGLRPSRSAYHPRQRHSVSTSPAASDEGQGTERGKHHRGRYPDRSYRQLLGDPVPNEDSRNIGEHHAESRADDNRAELLEPRGEANRGDLRLIPDFRDEKGTESR